MVHEVQPSPPPKKKDIYTNVQIQIHVLRFIVAMASKSLPLTLLYKY